MPSKSDLVVIKVFNNEVEAELARLRLEAADIPAMVSSDDSGGMYPQFQMVRGVTLRVLQDDLESAREILEADEESGGAEPDDT